MEFLKKAAAAVAGLLVIGALVGARSADELASVGARAADELADAGSAGARAARDILEQADELGAIDLALAYIDAYNRIPRDRDMANRLSAALETVSTPTDFNSETYMDTFVFLGDLMTDFEALTAEQFAQSRTGNFWTPSPAGNFIVATMDHFENGTHATRLTLSIGLKTDPHDFDSDVGPTRAWALVDTWPAPTTEASVILKDTTYWRIQGLGSGSPDVTVAATAQNYVNGRALCTRLTSLSLLADTVNPIDAAMLQYLKTFFDALPQHSCTLYQRTAQGDDGRYLVRTLLFDPAGYGYGAVNRSAVGQTQDFGSDYSLPNTF